MGKNLKKTMIVLSAASMAVGSVQTLAVAVEKSEEKYADGTFVGEGWGYYKEGSRFEKGKHKGELRQPLKIDVTFKDNKIIDLKLHAEEPGVEGGYVFPDDKNAYSMGGKKSIKFLKAKIEKSKSYKGDVEKLIKTLAEIEGKEDDEGFNKTSTMGDGYDVITSATITTHGLADALLDAINKSRNKANEIVNIKNIEVIERMDEENYFAGDEYDLGKLKVKITYEDEKESEVAYKDFEKNNLVVSITQNDENVFENGKIKLKDLRRFFDIKISDKNNSEKYTKLSPTPKLITYGPKNLFYRIGGDGEFKPVEISEEKLGQTTYKRYKIKLKSSDYGQFIELKSTEFIDNINNKTLEDEYFYKPVILEENSRFYVSVDGRGGRDSSEERDVIYPESFDGKGIKIEYKDGFVDDIESKREELKKLIEENLNSEDEKIKPLVERYSELEKNVKDKNDKIKDLSNQIQVKNQELEKINNSYKEEIAKEPRNYEKLRELINSKKEISQTIERLQAEKMSLGNPQIPNYDVVELIKDIKKANDPDASKLTQENKKEDLKEKIKKQVAIISDLVEKATNDSLKKYSKAKLEKAKTFLDEIEKADNKTNVLVYEWMNKELNNVEAKLGYVDKDEEKENTKKEDTKKENSEKENSKKEDTKEEDTKKEDTKEEDTKKEDSKKENTKKENKSRTNLNNNIEDKNETNVTRISGNDRFDTGVELSKKYFKKADTVVIASGNNYADALSASSLAGVSKAPILLVGKENVKESVINEISRLGAKKIIVIGGKASIGADVLSKFSKLGELEVIAGNNRYETSKMIADRLFKDGYNKNILLVDGKNYPDALSASSLSHKYNAPILLVDDMGSGMDNVNFVNKSNVEKSIILGGNMSVSKNVENKLNNTRRISGRDRYQTSRMVAKEVLGKNAELFVADGRNYPDSLSVGPVVMKSKSALILVNDTNYSGKNLKKDYIPTNINVIGGMSSVSNKILENLTK